MNGWSCDEFRPFYSRRGLLPIMVCMFPHQYIALASTLVINHFGGSLFSKLTNNGHSLLVYSVALSREIWKAPETLAAGCFLALPFPCHYLRRAPGKAPGADGCGRVPPTRLMVASSGLTSGAAATMGVAARLGGLLRRRGGTWCCP